jgi:hypothetical protein
MRSSGVVETADFASGVKGWRLDSANNGSAEFENVRIRGTLSTTVFEKETVNAVGGQLYIANSTMLTGSQNISASEATMSVVNVSGFTGSYGNNFGEVLSLKKVTDTGFSTEYVLIQSASRNIASSDTDFSGNLFVVRGYSGSLSSSNSTSSLGDMASVGQVYSPGQVMVSTGRSGSGYVRINANPNDQTTPYMDIVERTGSAIYDVDLKVRLGDLSGLSTAQVGSSPGFGLFTDRAFLTNDVTVGTLALEHIVIDSTSILFKDSSTTMAELRGTTFAIGGAYNATDNVVRVDTTGVKIYNDSNNYTFVSGSGMSVFSGGNQVAKFGSAVTLGRDGESRVHITAADLSMYDGTSGTPYRKVHIDSSGVIAIGGASNADVSTSTTDEVVRINSDGVKIYNDSSNYTFVSGSGMSIFSGGNQVAKFGAAVTLGRDGEARTHFTDTDLSMYSGQSTPYRRVHIDSDGTVAIGGATGADVSTSTTDEVVRIDSNGVYVYNDSSNYTFVSSSGMSVFSGGTQVGMFGSDVTLTGGSLTLQSTAGTTGDDRLVIGSANLTMYAANAAVLDIVDGKINIGPSAAGGAAVTGNVRVEGDNVYIYGDHTSTYTQMSSAGLRVY